MADKGTLFTKKELEQFEVEHPDGVGSQELIDLVQSRGFRFSEATFRKYVQHGHVNRCVRVGEKGKNKGSKGQYPSTTLRQINRVLRWTRTSRTLEELEKSTEIRAQKLAATILKASRELDELLENYNQPQNITKAKKSHYRNLSTYLVDVAESMETSMAELVKLVFNEEE